MRKQLKFWKNNHSINIKSIYGIGLEYSSHMDNGYKISTRYHFLITCRTP